MATICREGRDGRLSIRIGGRKARNPSCSIMAGHYAARHGDGRVAKLVLIGAVPPIMVKTAANSGGLPIEVFDEKLSHGMCTTHADVINRDPLAFIRS